MRQAFLVWTQLAYVWMWLLCQVFLLRSHAPWYLSWDFCLLFSSFSAAEVTALLFVDPDLIRRQR